ncbi:MAG: hypothetical protein COA69_10630 [Robiginitomaculum sp.]|nr:MAG: hypothetical protein COA69_10630 [Robiginitomaculum sp.]
MRPQIGKEKILEAALHLFAQNGFHTTSVNEIAVRAGVSKGLLYNYFDSKEEVLVTIIEQASEQMFEIARTLMSHGTYKERLGHFLDHYMNSLETHKTYFSFQLSLLFQPSLKQYVQKLLHRRIDYILQLTTEMFRKAGCEAPEQMARRFVCELDGVAVQVLSEFPGFPLHEVREQLFLNYRSVGT